MKYYHVTDYQKLKDIMSSGLIISGQHDFSGGMTCDYEQGYNKFPESNGRLYFTDSLDRAIYFCKSMICFSSGKNAAIIEFDQNKGILEDPWYFKSGMEDKSNTLVHDFYVKNNILPDKFSSIFVFCKNKGLRKLHVI